MTANLEYYKVFYYVAKAGSITLAAEELSISQPAVSQAVKQLETTLAVKLFSRNTKGVSLTAEGEMLFSYVAKGYEQISIGEQKLRQMMNLDFGELCIGASDMTLQFFLLPYLEKFHEEYPGIKVMVTNAPTPETIRFLQEGKIDFGVVSTPFEPKNELETVIVKEIKDIFVAGRKFIQYKHHTLDLQELEKLPLISLEKNTSTRTYMDQFLAKNGVFIRPEFELATSDMIVQFALRNLGIGMIMQEFAKEHLDSGKLFELRFNKIIPARHFCVITNPKNQLSTSARSLLNVIFKDVHN